MSSFEAQYLVEARKYEIEKILSFVTKSQSCQLISVPGAGRATVLRLLAFNKKLVEHHLKEDRKKYLFIYSNFAECGSFETEELHKFLFYSLLNILEENGELKTKVYELFTEALNLKDGLVLFQSLKKAMELLAKEDLVPVFLFDRFSEFANQTSNRFFSDLKTLRTASGGKLAIVFSTHRPLEELLSAEIWKDFWEFFVGNHIFLQLHDSVTTDFRLSILEKEYGKVIPKEERGEITRLTGGHGKLTKLSAQLLLSETETIPKEKVRTFLLSHILIQGALLEVWDSLMQAEQAALKEKKETELLKNLGLPFPLLSDFIEQRVKEKLIPKEIRFEEKDNEIYFGDDPIAGLTSYEFKLLQFLIKNPERLLSKDEIIVYVWSDEKTNQGVSDEALSQMIHRLRKKVEDESESPKHILTVKGRGIRFIP